jgi:hypothetical protein
VEELFKKIYLQNQTCGSINTLVMDKKRSFIGEDPDLGQDPEFLGYGFKIPDNTIDVKIPTEHRTKFQLSRYNSGRNISGRRADDITISVEHIF